MDTKSVKDAVHEATRFLKAAKAWHERMESFIAATASKRLTYKRLVA